MHSPSSRDWIGRNQNQNRRHRHHNHRHNVAHVLVQAMCPFYIVHRICTHARVDNVRITFTRFALSARSVPHLHCNAGKCLPTPMMCAFRAMSTRSEKSTKHSHVEGPLASLCAVQQQAKINRLKWISNEFRTSLTSIVARQWRAIPHWGREVPLRAAKSIKNNDFLLEIDFMKLSSR